MSGQSLTSINGVNATTVYNALVPKEGPKSVSTVLDFTAANDITVDFTLAGQEGKISAIQSVWVDNSTNPGPLTLTVVGTGQNIVFPAASCGALPIISATRPRIVCHCDATAIVRVVWLNVPLPVGVWGTGSGVVVAGDAFAIAIGGTAVIVFAHASAGAYITNPNNATESLFVDPVHVAVTASPGVFGTTTELVAGQSYAPPPGARVSVNASTSGHVFVAVG